MEYIYKAGRDFIYRNARPLDLARWQYQFEKGSKENVLKALSFYQNEDGGFGHALEADAWNPYSSPIQTWTATEILREIEFTDNTHPIISGILKYLESGQSFEGKFWYNTLKSNNLYPHAPWWHTESESTSHNDYNPTACLVGFIIRFAGRDSELYKVGSRIAREAFEQLMSEDRLKDMHTLACYIRLMEYIKESAATDIIDLETLEIKLKEQVKSSITKNIKEWETSYICKPSQFLHSKDSIFYSDNKEQAEYECEFIIKSQLEDGSWNIPWGWSEYPNEWAISKNWWKANGIILNMRYLRNFGRL